MLVEKKLITSLKIQFLVETFVEPFSPEVGGTEIDCSLNIKFLVKSEVGGAEMDSPNI